MRSIPLAKNWQPWQGCNTLSNHVWESGLASGFSQSGDPSIIMHFLSCEAIPDSRNMAPLTTNVGNWNHSEIDPSCWKLLATLERLQYTEQSCLRIRVGMWFSARVVDPSIIIMHYWSWNRLTIKVNKMSHTPVCFACHSSGPNSANPGLTLLEYGAPL